MVSLTGQGREVIVAGAGIWGCTVARRLAEAGRRVLVLEKRPEIGGNCASRIDPETGIEIHSYGSHIFHTHNRAVWDFVRRFTDFNGYQHKVLAKHRGKMYHLPLGLALVNKFFDVELTPAEVSDFMADSAHATAVFEAFFRGYTAKQWGCAPEEVDPEVIRRVPVRANYDTNYFNDLWQGVPSEGYGMFFARLLDHPNITVRCNEPFALDDVRHRGRSVYYSGPIDGLFGYRFGALPWRSLRFETERLAIADFQGTSVVNYVDGAVPYTRIHEFKHYHPERREILSLPKTVIVREYPKAWTMGDEPYYPVKNPVSEALLARYREEAARFPGLVVGGRLGDYRYCDMDQAMASALSVDIG